jgi:hypothetical protein
VFAVLLKQRRLVAGVLQSRLLTGALMLAGLFLAGAAALLSFLRKDWFTTRIRKLEACLLRGENHAIVVLGLVSTLIVCVVLLVIRAMAPPDTGMLVVAVERIQFLILWGIAGLIQGLALMWMQALRNHKSCARPLQNSDRFWDRDHLMHSLDHSFQLPCL